ncbi:MAG: TolC family protein [Planctomycetota bacterium]
MSATPDATPELPVPSVPRTDSPVRRHGERRRGRATAIRDAILGAPLLLVMAGCSTQSAFDGIDARVDELLSGSARDASLSVTPRSVERPVPGAVELMAPPEIRQERPATVNPDAADLEFVARASADAAAVIQRLDGYAAVAEDRLVLDLQRALDQSTRTSREFRFAEEEYVLAALRLLIERHRWGPRFFDDVSATITADPDDGTYDVALSLVNELGVTQRLPYGGTVSASLLARATEDLRDRVAGTQPQSAEFLLSANLPLLRGAGTVAREGIVQAEPREFERFRREFLFDIANEYLNLVVLQRSIGISEAQVESFRQVESQQIALQEAGRATPFDADEARNETLDAIASLNSARERFRLAVDRFKVRLGIPIDTAVEILDDEFALPVPEADLDAAVVAAMRFRLDLQNQRDSVVDRRRALFNARNDLLADLNLSASASMPTDPAEEQGGLGFEPDETEFRAGVTLGLPLDREIERLGIRTAQINLARAERNFDRFRDDVAVSVRAAVRGIDAAAFDLRIQEQNVVIAAQRKAAIDADPARANIRQTSDAINALARARSARDNARRNLEVAILDYLLQTGQLRVGPDGSLAPLGGMAGRGEPTPPSEDRPEAAEG